MAVDAAAWCSGRGGGSCRSLVALAAAALTFGAVSAGRRVADDGLDRRAARAHRPRRRLRDPAPGARRGGAPRRRAQAGGHAAAVDAAARRGAPTVATAAAATAAGFLVLALSPLPMVRGFGILLVAGIALALTCALTAGRGGADAADAARRRGGARRPGLPPAVARGGAAVAASGRGAAELLTQNRAARAARGAGAGATARVLRTAVRRPGPVLAAAAALAVAGWGLDTQTKVESDVTKLVPQRLGALRDLQQLQRSTGVGGQVDVLVQGRDLTDPAVVGLDGALPARRPAVRRLRRRRAAAGARRCARPSRCPTCSPRARRAARQVTGLLDAVPPYFSQGVISEDRQAATLSFGLRLMPIADQQRVLDGLRARLHPPPGVRARLAGLPVLVAEANDAISSPWRRVAHAARRACWPSALVLLVAFRRWRRARDPARPDRAGHGLVGARAVRAADPAQPAVGDPGRARGRDLDRVQRAAQRALPGRAPGRPHDARRRSRRRTPRPGAAVLASGVTAIAGFAVLVVSDIAHAARLRLRHGRRPRRLAAGRARRPARPCSSWPSGAPPGVRAGRPARRPARRPRDAGAGAPRPRRVVIGGDGRDGARLPARADGLDVLARRRRRPSPPSSTSCWGRCAPSAAGRAGPAVGTTLPPFAAPLATSRLEGDVNVARHDGQGQAGAPGGLLRPPARRADDVRAGPARPGGPGLLHRGRLALRRRARRARPRRAPPPRRPGRRRRAARGPRVAAAARPAPPVVASRSPRTATGSWPTSTASSSART